MFSRKKPLIKSLFVKFLIFTGSIATSVVAVFLLYPGYRTITYTLFVVGITGFIVSFLYYNRDQDKGNKIREKEEKRREALTKSFSYRKLSFKDKQKCHRFWNKVVFFSQLTKDKNILETRDDFRSLIDDIFSYQNHPHK